MPMLDLSDYPINMPGQPARYRLTLADVYHLCYGSKERKISDVAASYSVLGTPQRIALVKLAYHVARSRGAETIASLTLDQMLQSGKISCPLTLGTGFSLPQASLFSNGGSQPIENFAQLMDWSSSSLWDSEIEKARLCNAVPMSNWPSIAVSTCRGAFTPTPGQLWRLIVELEKRVADAMGSAGPDGWKLDTTFGASTAWTSITVGKVLHAHEYNFIIFPNRFNPDPLMVHNDSAADGYKEREHWGYSSDAALVRFSPALPSFASFVSPSAALATFVCWATREDVKWQTAPEKEFWAMAKYFVMLLCVTSGREFATTLATRPTPTENHLPKLDDEVASCARAHGTDARHTRVFPEFAAAQGKGKGKRKRAQQDEDEEDRVPRPEDVRVWEVERVSAREDVYYSWRAARIGSKAERQCDEEVLKSAIWHYNVALDNHTEALVKAFDSGRGFDLSKLLLGWQAVYDALGEEGQRLRELRKKLRSAQEDVATWLGKVVDHHKRDAENGVAPP